MKKLTIENLKIKSFVTEVDRKSEMTLQGGAATRNLDCFDSNLAQCGSRVDACVTAQICSQWCNTTAVIGTHNC